MTPKGEFGIREFAAAKINLTLEIAGRRSDGFHELASLVVFASVGDVVTLDPGLPPGLSLSGVFADRLAGANILGRALDLLDACKPKLELGAVHLEKSLPVAAGIGGGSADAGALLRAVRRTNVEAGRDIDWHGLARELGADVPVCFESRPLWMTGTGERLAELGGVLPALHAVLVNPMAAVPADKTARVFRALGAEPLAPDYAPPPAPKLADRGALIDFARERGNDLGAAAEAVVPEIGQVLSALRRAPGIEHAAVSGAGPTCFGIFPDGASADAARQQLAAEHPSWWTASTTLGGGSLRQEA
ncbi:4-(cytidine 5'-diphospho)-2-C-methyl-D-erythritol kinase [Hyphomicrobium sp. LHD-15]|uniref:4-(cytidine 5'-diphospho)-2-C-methyl-D-erythritol kinase n=1 Tax=Hyphomicrobium sp. LHD-15 TaxID=3072142 RepID=UPI00280C4B57|nr:4-(cytidine 5'-diphospho)-2-C-methyl-D-erythritol kinase [Hyphomicrobium sp. LHD-15]MDQ8699390.1 4-(cytidine 5'-diphospho)-2-C-methyl-D-erythritol kinase [Hyphomicrobium sp. LHD-15]